MEFSKIFCHDDWRDGLCRFLSSDKFISIYAMLDMFNDNSPWQSYTAILFVIFIFVMTIIIMNLITGLALDDIQKIAENAEYKKLTMQVK